MIIGLASPDVGPIVYLTKKERRDVKNATIEVCAKCSDLWSHTVIGADGTVQSSYDGYVPSFMPGDHYGDYVMMTIDPYTGKILNWKKWKKAKKQPTKKRGAK